MRGWMTGMAGGLLAGALAGCGGGSGGGVASTPTPTPSASYTPIASLTGNQSFQTGGLSFEAGTAPSSAATRRPFGTGLRLDYVAASDSYTLTAPEGFTVSINAGNIVTAQSTTERTFYDKTSGATRDLVMLYRPSVNGVALSYTMLGSWNHMEGLQSAGRIQLVAGGVPTLASDMPRSGSATYDLTVNGSVVPTGSLPHSLNGLSSGTFSVDFGAGTLSTSMTLRGVAPMAGSMPVDFGTASGTGTITSGGSGFAGSFSGTLAGQFSGGFFGPQAAEAGYAWGLSGNGLDARGLNAAKKR